jgi:hypothetical protein
VTELEVPPQYFLGGVKREDLQVKSFYGPGYQHLISRMQKRDAVTYIESEE